MEKIKLEELILQNNELLSNLKSEKEANLQYQQVLERTNSQLGIWTNPYGIMIGALGVLFTVMTIIAAIFIWWQSREHRRMIDEQLKKFFDEKQKNALELMDNKGKEIEERLKTASGEEKERLEEEKKQIKNLELEIRAGIPDLGQYMKKDDFICSDCLQKDIYSDFGIRNSFLDIQFKARNFSGLGNKKCLSCGNKFY